MGNSFLCIHRDCPESKRTLQICLSEKEYLPMPLDMRKALLDGKKFRHVLPSRERPKNLESEKREEKKDNVKLPLKGKTSEMSSRAIMFKDEVLETELSFVEEVSNESPQTSNQSSLTPQSHSSLIELSSGVKKSKFTLKLEEKLRQSKLELGFDADLDDWKEFSYVWEDSHEKRKESAKERSKSPQKRRSVSRSVFGSDTNLHKGSYPTSQAISKRLGSDLTEESISKHFSITHLPKDWAQRHLRINPEDTYDVSNEMQNQNLDKIYKKHLNHPRSSLKSHESYIEADPHKDKSDRKKCSNRPIDGTPSQNSPVHSLNNFSNCSGIKLRGNSTSCLRGKMPPDKTSVAVSLKNSAPEYCTHNCQILGLCSVSKPPTCVSFEPSSFKEEISRKYDVKNLLKGEFGKHSRENCSCDLCTLAFLTEMGFPGDGDRGLENTFLEETRKTSGSSMCSILGSGDKRREKIRIVEKGGRFRSVEVSVSTKHSGGDSSSCKISDEISSKSNTSTETAMQDITNLKIRKMFQKSNKLTSFKDTYSANKSFNDFSVVNHSTEHNTVEPAHHMPNTSVIEATASFTHENRNSSSSILGASISSSLSTVMSYRRVRKIFQSFIEKNRSRKRVKKNIHKFKEMEELGLGELKNNRWYPSECKTYSIWNSMHSNVKGVQAEFKKYHKK